MNTFTRTRNARIFLLTALLCIAGLNGFSTTWTTVSAGSIYSYSNWSDGSGSPTSFTTPGDVWTITLPMTVSSGMPWNVGTASTTPVTVNISSGGSIRGGAGGFQFLMNVYGNLNMADSIVINGGGCTILMNIFGNLSMTAGAIDAEGGACILKLNVNGNFTMTGGGVVANGGLANDTINIKGNFEASGASYIQSNGGSATGNIFLSRPSSAGTMMIANTSTGSWTTNNVYIDANCTAQLSGNFSTNTGGSLGLTVNGTLSCPTGFAVNGSNKFTLNSGATLKTGHATGINTAIVSTGTKTFSNSANYGFNGTVAQVTGTDMPASLADPDSIIIDNAAGVTLSQNTATTGKLVFVSGVLKTGAYTITVPGMAANVVGAGASSYVDGKLKKTINGLTSVNYEVGDLNYAPMLLTFNNAGTSGSLGIQANVGIHPSYITSGFSGTNMVNHYWTITNYAAAGPDTVLPKATYNLVDIGGGFNTYFATQIYKGSSWLTAQLPTTNTASPYTSAPNTGIALDSLAGDYVFGRLALSLSAGSVAQNGVLKVFPNPNNGTFTLIVNSGTAEEINITITDVLGKKIKEFTAAGNQQMNIRMDQPNGIYFLSAIDKEGTFTAKVIVE